MLRTEIEEIIEIRLKDAEVLLKASRFNGSVYLCGYAVELFLKASICKTLNWIKYPTTGNKYKTFKTHDLDVLLHLTGFEDNLKSFHMLEWSIVAQWRPEARYKIQNIIKSDAQDMLNATKELIRNYERTN